MDASITVKQVDGLTFVGKGISNHWVVMDGPEEFGGANAGTRPMELVLVGLGGCTGADVVSLLKKMRVNVDKFEIHIHAQRAEEHPRVYTRIDMVYKFWGKNLKASESKIIKAVDLSQEKYCSVSAMLRMANIPVNYTCELIETK